MPRHALVVGATGISGGNVARRLLDDGWRVSGLSRRADGLDPRVDAPRGRPARRGRGGRRRPGHGPDPRLLHDLVALRHRGREHRGQRAPCCSTCWTRSPRRARSATSRWSPASSTTSGRSRPTRKAQPDTPFSEEQPRLPYENFYYVQEDILWAAAERDGFTWSVHRPHTMIGWALGNAMNMGVTLAVYAAICRETGPAVPLPGLAAAVGGGHRRDRRARCWPTTCVWAATTPAAANEALNIVNGDVFRWRRLWPRLAAALGVEAGGLRRRARAARAADGRRRGGLAAHRAARTACATSPSTRWRRGGTRTPTSGGPSRPSPTWARSRRLGFAGVQRHRVLVHRSLRPPARRAHRAVSTTPAAPAGR